MHATMQTRFATLTALAFLIAGCDGGPQQLASTLDAALKAGDMDAALTLLDRGGVPPSAQYFYLKLVADCATEGATCKVSTAPVTEDYKKKESEQAAQMGAELKPAPDGLIEVALEAKTKHGTTELPYAKVDGQYRIVSQRYTAAKVAELKAKTAQSITDALLAKGVHQPDQPNDPDWKAKASPLPPGGAEAGAWFIAYTKAVAAAVKAGDVTALHSLYEEASDINVYVYTDKDDQGKPVSAGQLRYLRLNMRAEAVKELQDVTVLGGYQLGEIAALSYEGHDGAGWIKRGCAVLKHDDKGWKPMVGNSGFAIVREETIPSM